MHTAEPRVPKASSFEVGIATEKLKRFISPGTDEIPAELIQAGGNILCSETHKLINSIWNKEDCHCSGRNLLLYIFIRVIKLTVVIIVGYHCY